MDSLATIGYEFGVDLYADCIERRIIRSGKRLRKPLTAKEFEILIFFLDRPKQVIPRADVSPLNDVHRSTRHPLDDYLSKINIKMGWKANQHFILIRKVGYQ